MIVGKGAMKPMIKCRGSWMSFRGMGWDGMKQEKAGFGEWLRKERSSDREGDRQAGRQRNGQTKR